MTTAYFFLNFGNSQDLLRVAELLELPHLQLMLTSDYRSDNTNYETFLKNRIGDICLGQGLFADVIFELDDGACAAHKPMLAARCDVMKAMFGGDFREGQAKVVIVYLNSLLI